MSNIRKNTSVSPNRRHKDLTNLEMEALTLVNEEILGPAVTDEEKYEQLLEGRKSRKPVSFFQITIHFIFLYFIIGRRTILVSRTPSW